MVYVLLKCYLVWFNSGAKMSWEVIIKGFVRKVTAQGRKKGLLFR